jgi:hypothetical protein
MTSAIDSPEFLQDAMEQAMRAGETRQTFRMEHLQFIVEWAERCPTVTILAPMDHPKADHMIVLARDMATMLVSELYNNDYRSLVIREDADIHKGSVLTACEITDYYS